APKLASVAKERVMYELSVVFSSNAFRTALDLLHRTALDEVLGIRPGAFHADDVSFAGSLALAGGDHLRWSHTLLREVATLRRLIDHHDRIALYDAGEPVASQLPALLRAVGRDDRLDLPDFSIRALLTGDEIVALTGVDRGPRLGAIKRALLEAQIRGEVRTRDEAVTFVRDSVRNDRDSSH
ncbi:MAG TPA: hypothetical protein VMU84_16960, partial [Thermoanaerobaculia bacterium]|nr:hypothetical protein [Thermoanaerobaculia bacterium]